MSIPQLPATADSPATTLSVVIVSWNTRDLLAQCLTSVFAQTQLAGGADMDVWVVDNASTDGSADMVRSQFPQVHLIENTGNPGFAAANNQAMLRCAGDYVMLLNPDTRVLDNAFEPMLTYLRAHAEAGAVGPRILNPDLSLQESTYPLPTLAREVWRLFHLDKLRPIGIYRMGEWDTTQPRPVESILGACLLARRTALAQVGLLDDDYFIYSEEIDLCQRLARANWRLVWIPGARVIHFGGQSTRQAASAMFIRLYQGKILFFRKHLGAVQTRLYKLVLAASALPRLGLFLLAPALPAARRPRARGLASAYWMLIKALPSL